MEHNPLEIRLFETSYMFLIADGFLWWIKTNHLKKEQKTSFLFLRRCDEPPSPDLIIIQRDTFTCSLKWDTSVPLQSRPPSSDARSLPFFVSGYNRTEPQTVKKSREEEEESHRGRAEKVGAMRRRDERAREGGEVVCGGAERNTNINKDKYNMFRNAVFSLYMSLHSGRTHLYSVVHDVHQKAIF